VSTYIDAPIFVLGLPRSGTSMVAGCLIIGGAWAGTTVVGGEESNPRGFFEHIYIRERVVKRILEQAQCDPLGVAPLPSFDKNLRISGLATRIATALAVDGYRNDKPWLYKDAKLTLLWSAFAHAFPKARWVIVTRDKASIIDSCLRTPFMNQHSQEPSFWKNYVHEYRVRLNLLQESGMEHHEISADRIICGDFSSLRDLTRKLGLTFKESEVREFVTPRYWHTIPEHESERT